MNNLTCGLHSGHDCSYCILEDGIPILHVELERYLRVKEPFGDAFEIAEKDFDRFDQVQNFAHTLDTWKGGLLKRYPKSFVKMWKQIARNDGIFSQPGHHEAHAANAFFSSNFGEAVILTLDGGGRDYYQEDIATTCTTYWYGKGNELKFWGLLFDNELNIGGFWASITRDVMGLSVGYPKGNQCGTVMAMAAFGDPERFKEITRYNFNPYVFRRDVAKFQDLVKTEQDKFDLAASLQKHTEETLIGIVRQLLEKGKTKNLCLAGGVALNSVAVGKLLDEFPGINIYIPPVPPDSGLSIGAAQYLYHVEQGNARINWNGNASPYLGKSYDLRQTQEAILGYLEEYGTGSSWSINHLIKELEKGKIISVFSGGSESGRRALGNRSILADPRNPKMKDLINEKVKHRVWFRPFAPSILRERVEEWFEHDVDSPYMSMCLKFKKDKLDSVPAVVHKDGTARLQTVTEKDNKWYYNFLKAWEEKTGVPIILNTSFNDTTPIVETPIDAMDCFHKTEIDGLYFVDHNIYIYK